MSTIWRGMKKIFRGQIKLRKQVEEQTSRLDRIEEGLRRSQSAGPSTHRWSKPTERVTPFLYLFHAYIFLHTLGTMHEIGMGGVDTNIGFFSRFSF